MQKSKLRCGLARSCVAGNEGGREQGRFPGQASLLFHAASLGKEGRQTQAGSGWQRPQAGNVSKPDVPRGVSTATILEGSQVLALSALAQIYGWHVCLPTPRDAAWPASSPGPSADLHKSRRPIASLCGQPPLVPSRQPLTMAHPVLWASQRGSGSAGEECPGIQRKTLWVSNYNDD